VGAERFTLAERGVTDTRLKDLRERLPEQHRNAIQRLEGARRQFGLLLLKGALGEEVRPEARDAVRQAVGTAITALEELVLLAAAAEEQAEALEVPPPVVDHTAARREARRVFDAAKSAMRTMSFRTMTRSGVRAEGVKLLELGRRCGRVPEAKELLAELAGRVNAELLADLA
jgi:hypothetical protein